MFDNIRNEETKECFEDCEYCEGKGVITIYNAYDQNSKKVEICPCCHGTGLSSGEDYLLV